MISATEWESKDSERFHSFPTLFMTPSFTSGENQIVGLTNHNARSGFTRLNVIALVVPLLLTTPTTLFSLHRKRRSRKRNQDAVVIRS